VSEDVKGDPAPYYRAHVFVCTNEREPGHPRGCCRGKGGDQLRDYMKKKATGLGLGKAVRINNAGCLDRCELGPVMVVYPEGVWYAVNSTADIDEVLQTHLVEGGRVERLLLSPSDKFPADREARQTAAE
jgi:(2Fe-2S) ferredoxin